MATARFAWGIDVGNRALKAVRLVRAGDQYRIDDFEVIEHEQVLSNAGDNKESLIQTALANFVQRHPMKGGAVAIGVSGQSSFARFIKLPPVEPKKIPEIVRFEAIQQIPFPLDDVEWSYQLFQSEASPDIEVGIFAMRKELINQHLKYFTDVDLNVQAVQMSPLAVYNAMHFDDRFSGTTLIIDLGAENCDLIIADRDSVWLRSIPIGGNSFTEALVKSFKLNFAKAEDLKRNAATSKYARQIFQAMRPVFADLVAEIQRSIGFYASVHRESRIQKVVTIGGTFRLPGLLKYLQQNLQLDVERLNSFAAGAPSDSKLATAFNDNMLSLVTAYGLAVQAMGEGKITSSLLPQHIRRAKLWQEKTKWFGAAAALFVLGTGIAYGSIYVHNLNSDKNWGLAKPKIDDVQRQATKLSGDWKRIEDAGGSDRAQIQALQSLQKYRSLWINLLADIHKALPQHAAGQPPVTDPAKIKQVKRTDRKLVLIDSIRAQYHEDISPYLADAAFQKAALPENPNPVLETYAVPSFEPEGASAAAGNLGGGPGGGPGGGMGGPGFGPPAWLAGRMGPGMGPPVGLPGQPGQSSGPKVKGLLLTIRCSSPNGAGMDFVRQTLVRSLQAITPATASADRPYAVVKADITYALPVKEDSARLTQLKNAFQAKDRARKEIERLATPAIGRMGVPAIGVNLGYRGADAAGVPGIGAGQPGGAPGAGFRPPMGGPGRPGGFGPPSGFGPMNPFQQTPVNSEGSTGLGDREAYLDPVTGESLLEDWTYTVVLAIAIDPAPAPKAAPAAKQQPKK